MALHRKHRLVAGFLALLFAGTAQAQIRITEWMYDGVGGEFVELTNVGGTAVDMTNWRFDDDSASYAMGFDLSGFGTVQPGESVAFTEAAAESFRSDWNLCSGVKLLGGYTNNLGRADQINIFDGSGALVDKLTFGDQAFPGSIRTTGRSGWVSAAGLGVDNVFAWTLSTLGDGEGSLASSGGAIGSPGRSTRASVAYDACDPGSGEPDPGEIRITEWMYDGVGGEFVELTNVGGTAVDMANWRFDDDSASYAEGFDLSGFGTVQPGESVVFTEAAAESFRSDWNLCSGVKLLGGYTNNLGRADQINIFDGSSALVDKLTFGDQAFPGSIRTTGRSGWVSAAGLGVDNVFAWTLSTVGDGEGSLASTGGAIGSPGRSTRATVAYQPCIPPVGGAPSIAVDQPIAVGAIGDPTNPSAMVTLADPDSDLSSLVVTVTSSNASVLPAANVTIDGTGATRNVSFNPVGRGVSTLTLTVTDPDGFTGTAMLTYAASNQAPDPSGRYHHHISDASGALDVGDGYFILLNDETNTIFLHRQDASGPPVKTWTFTPAQLGTGSEIDLEGITRSGDLVLMTGSHGNNRSGEVRTERRTLVAATISGSGAGTELSFRGRYNNLWAELRNWDQGNGHGLGANALGFIAATAPGVLPNPPNGFNIEGLEFAPDGTTAYFGFRAPTINVEGTYRALIVPLLNPAAITDGAPGTGPAQFGAPILVDLGGRSIRSIASNTQGDYLISAGPTPQNATWALYTWDGNPDHPPRFNRELPPEDALTGGTWEAIGAVPHPLVEGATVRVIADSGDTNFYGTGMTKDLAQGYQKSYSQLFTLAAVPVAAAGGIRITEWMYDGVGGEFVELTNVGDTAIDMTGWRFDDDSASYAEGFDLSGFGTVQPGESVVFTETAAESFRSDWNLCSGVKLLGGYTNNLGRADQINIFDGSGTVVDRLTFGDQAFPGSIRTTGRSGWVSAAGLGVDNVFAWTLSTVGDGEGSLASSGGAIGSPGRSTRASVAFTPCGTPPSLAISPADLSSTLVAGQGEEQVLTLANTGEEPLAWHVTEQGESCALPSWIIVDPLQGSIAGAGNQAVNIGFQAMGLAAGNYGAALCIASNDPAQPVASVPLSLVVTAVPAPLLAFDPPVLDFGDVQAGTPGSPKAATLRNIGNADASGLSFSAPGSGFAVDGSACGTGVAAGSSCVVIATFAPTETGAASAALAVDSTQGATATLALQGTGIAPPDPVTDLAVGIQVRKAYVHRGQLLDYLVSISNLGPDAASGASVAGTLSAALDVDFASWLRLGTTASGQGNLVDSGLAIAAGGSVSYLVSAPVRADADGAVTMQVQAAQEHDTDTSNNTAEATSQVVIHRDGFETEGDWGTSLPLEPMDGLFVPGDVVTLAWPAPGQALVETVLEGRPAVTTSAAFRLERLSDGSHGGLRLVVKDADGTEYATPWIVATTGAELKLVLVDAESVDGDGRRMARVQVGGAELRLPLAGRPAGYRLRSAVPLAIAVVAGTE